MLEIREYNIAPADVADEIARFHKALATARDHLEQLASQLQQAAGNAAEEIIRTHIHMLDDAVIADETRQRISQDCCNAEWALQLQLDIIIRDFKHLDDDYIRSREEDVIQVVRLLQQSLVTGGE